jgi:hypothetical protein
MRQLLLILLWVMIYSSASSQKSPLSKIILFEDDFSKNLDSNHWIVEKQAADSEIVATRDGKLLIDTYGGATLWYKKELKGNILITYKRKVIIAGGKNDRLSDLNQFWMATDPGNAMFKRKGGFAEYDSLSMYYVGMGGNYNQTTRFRKYNKGDKKIIGEYTDSLHLLEANKEYEVAISMVDGWVTFSVDGKKFFSWKDEQVFTQGYFAIRSTRSRQEIDDLKIYQLQ